MSDVMAPFRRVGTQGHATDNSASQSHEPAAHRVLPPFSRELRVDRKLKWSHVDFINTIEAIHQGKVTNATSQLTATPAFPTPHVLAQFASKTYTDCKKKETVAQYETRLALPDGWKLLTTASNSSKANGYFGAAYWHPEHQQVVIAHRGTKLTNLGALWTDVVGVVFKHHVPQMGSASTFAHKVVEVLQDVNQKEGTNFQVFLTGHSLGGWLAQITTFTTKYLKIEGNTFLKSDNIPQSYHPHTVVFDSPGCKDMLSQMTENFDVRLHGRSIDIEQLDITSYLSAPNRINTCNRHLGTVYRIFPDLSDMGWWEKNTALYNKVTHSMDKIVVAFDPNTGQIRKDEMGNLKIQVVVDWPVTAGLSGGKEYKSFFKWAKHFNNYDPHITEEIFRLKDDSIIRYQVVTYDDRVCRLTVFCQQERQFLESYRWLHQLPEFLRPKELLSEMKDKQAQEKAEKLLGSFKIEKDTFHCTDGSTLQALIPYVKQLLQLFPQISENVESVLSSQEIVRWFYRVETRRYLEQIKQSPHQFEADASSLIDFENNEEQQVLQLRMVDGDAWTGLIKVHQVLEKTRSMNDRLSEGHYTVLTLQHWLLVDGMFSLNTLLQSTTAPHLLMMSCETNQLLNVERKQIIKSLFNTLRQKQNVKIILTTQSEGDTVTFLQDIAKETLSNGFVTRDDSLSWSDLTTSSQEKLLESTVRFQGSEIALNQLISPNSPVTKFLPLAALLEKNILMIGKSSASNSSCNFYDKGYYIDRIFTHQIVINHAILHDKRENKFSDLLASNGQEFKQHCQLNPKSNVHWLEKNNSGKLLWQKSQGSLETLRKYIDTDSSHKYTADDLDKLLEQAQHQRVMLISDTAGMGKSIILTHLSEQIKKKFPTKWAVRIDLNDHTHALEALRKVQIDKEKAIEFVSEKLLELEPGLDLELFKECCEQKQKGRIVIMLDGFDEISPFYKETVIDLLHALRQTAVEQLWVTTRPHLRKELEDHLQVLSYTLEPFSEENQVEFLLKFWCLNDWFSGVGNEAVEEVKIRLVNYAKHLIKKLSELISDKNKQFTGIPLQCRMLAEAFDIEVQAFCQSTEFVPELLHKLDLIGLFEKFIERKYEIFVQEKGKISTTNLFANEARKELIKKLVENHQILALKMLFAEEQLDLLHIDSQCTSLDETLTRTGIVQISNGGKLHFIHRTFSEFYVAEYFVKELKKGSNISQQLQDLLLQKIFLENEYRVIRVFIDGLLTRSKPQYEVLKQYGNHIHDLGNDGVLKLHTATCENNANIIGFILDSVQAAGHADTLVKLLLAQDVKGQTAWHLAANHGQLEALEKLWECAKEVLNRDDLNKNLFLIQDYSKETVLHHASYSGNVQILEGIWKLAKEQLTPKELNKFLLTQNNRKRTAWHMAVSWGKVEILDKLWELAKEVLNRDELNNKLLLAEDDSKEIVLHHSLYSGNVQILERIWKLAKEQLSPEGLNKLFLAQNNRKRTAWHVAAERGKVEILDKLWECAKQVLNRDTLNNYLLLAQDELEDTALHLALYVGNVQILERIWKLAKEQMSPEDLNKLLLAPNYRNRTAWHVAAQEGKVEILDKLWEWAKEGLDRDDLNENLLLVQDYSIETVLHHASYSGNIQVLERIWKLAKEQLSPGVLNTFLLAKNIRNRTAWHAAVCWGKVEISDKLWEFAKEVLKRDELNNKLFLAKDLFGETALHSALYIGNVQVLKRIWELAKEQLTPEKLNKLLARVNYSKSNFHPTADDDIIEIAKYYEGNAFPF